jgi:DNA mismatch repair protein PMS2
MITDRCYAAATLELSQLDNEERKARALAAATTELERLFRKEDFGRMKVVICIIHCLSFYTFIN